MKVLALHVMQTQDLLYTFQHLVKHMLRKSVVERSIFDDLHVGGMPSEKIILVSVLPRVIHQSLCLTLCLHLFHLCRIRLLGSFLQNYDVVLENGSGDSFRKTNLSGKVVQAG